MSRRLPVASAVQATAVLGAYEPALDSGQRPGPALDTVLAGAEFPAYDAPSWAFLQRARTRKLAARRLEHGSYTPETVLWIS